jgi:acetyltransferase-like isoleucine patch superfamily enzyme
MDNRYHHFGSKISTSAKIFGEKISIGPFTVIEDYVTLLGGFHDRSSISVGSRCKIKQGVVIRTYGGEIKIGNRVSIGEYSVLAGHSKLEVGDCTIIAAHCYLSAASHIFVSDGTIRFQGEKTKGIIIGRDCWIGGNTMILDDVRVGDGCVIGAGSVVTRDLPGGAVCHGSPCQVIGKREPFLSKEMIR